jgi:hypothetical protein
MAVGLVALIVAASASASGFISGSGSGETYLRAEQATQMSLTTVAGTQKCSNQKLEGTMPAPTEHLSVPVTKDAECSLGTLKMNGCKFILNPGQGNVDIGPNGCGPVTLFGGCQITIPTQYGLSTTYQNVGSGSEAYVLVSLSTSSLSYTENLSSCGKGTYGNGKLVVEWALKAYSDAARTAQTSLRVGAANGLYLAGNPGKLEAEAYDAAVIGEQSQIFTFNATAGKVKCVSALFDGDQISSSVSSWLLGISAYSGCTAFGLTGKVTTNGCGYTFGVGGSGPYTGSQELSCGAKGLEFVALQGGEPRCTISIPSQALGSVSYENTGAGSAREVVATVSGSGNSYSISYPPGKEEGKCGSTGSYTNGTNSGAITLHSFH